MKNRHSEQDRILKRMHPMKTAHPFDPDGQKDGLFPHFAIRLRKESGSYSYTFSGAVVQNDTV